MLTFRETEVAVLIAEGLTNREIAARLLISQRTAESHVEKILTKLGFSSRTQVAIWAMRELGTRSGGPVPTEPGGPHLADLSDTALLRYLRSGSGSGTSDDAASVMAVLRRRMDDHLRRLDTVAVEIDKFEAALDGHTRAYAASPGLLADLGADFVGVRGLLELRLTDHQLRRCYRILTRLATLMAGTLALAGQYHEGLCWLETARPMAARCSERAMQVWGMVNIRARVSMYTGHPERALTEVRQALRKGPVGPAATLWALDFQVQLLAELGRAREALDVLGRLTAVYERCPSLPRNLPFGFAEQRLHATTLMAHGRVGDTHRAAEAYQAFQEGGSAHYLRSIMTLERTVSLIRDGEIEEACRVGTDAFTGLSAEHRTGLLRDKLALTLNRIPPRYRKLACVTELRTLTSAG